MRTANGSCRSATKDKDDDPPPFEIRSRRWRFISRQIEGNYPNWRQVVPDGEGTQTTIDIDPEAVEAILQTITRMPDHDAVNHGLGLEVIGHQVRLHRSLVPGRRLDARDSRGREDQGQGGDDPLEPAVAGQGPALRSHQDRDHRCACPR